MWPPATSGMYPHSERAQPLLCGVKMLIAWLAARHLADLSRNGFLLLGFDAPTIPPHPKGSPFRSALIGVEVIDKVAVPIIIKGLWGERLTEVEGPPQLLFQHTQAENFCWFINFKGLYSGCQLLHLKLMYNRACVRQPAREDFQAPAPCESNR